MAEAGAELATQPQRPPTCAAGVVVGQRQKGEAALPTGGGTPWASLASRAQAQRPSAPSPSSPALSPGSEESLAKTNNVTWVDGYRPGHDEITLRWDDGAGKYVLDINEVAKPNLRYKKDCILEILKAAVEVGAVLCCAVLRGRRAARGGKWGCCAGGRMCALGNTLGGSLGRRSCQAGAAASQLFLGAY